MKAFILEIDGTPENARRALGSVVVAAIRSPEGRRLFDKGHVITEADLPVLLSLATARVPLLRPEEGDVHEEEAALALGGAAAGEGIEVLAAPEGRARLVARHNGLLRVDARTLEAMNSVGCVSIYALFDGHPVKAGEVVAEAKITPLLAPMADLQRARAYAANPPLAVLPFRPLHAAALIIERVSPTQARRVAEGLRHKLVWFGSTLEQVSYAAPGDPAETIAGCMREALDNGTGVLFVSGGSAANPFDTLLRAIEEVPARMERLGIPSHPGSTLWLAHAGEVPIIGVPSCGLFSQTTSLDLLLPVLHTREGLTARTFAAMGHGGLLKSGDWRLPNYDA